SAAASSAVNGPSFGSRAGWNFGNLMVSSQRHDIRLGKRVTTHRTASLSVEDSGDLRIIEFLSQLTHQLHDLLRSFRCGCPRCEPFDIPFGDGSSFPYDANAITFFFGGELNLLD